MSTKTKLPQVKIMSIEALVKGMVHNSRMEINDVELEKLAANIKVNGLIHMPAVSKVEGYDHLCVVAGVMRILASKLNGETSIAVHVLDGELSMPQLKAKNISENINRSTPQHDEMVPMIVDMKKAGMTPAEIVACTGLKGNQVGSMLQAMTRVPKKYRNKIKNTSVGEFVEDGEISGSCVKAVYNAYKQQSINTVERDEVYDLVVDKRLDTFATKELLDALKKKPRGDANRVSDAYTWSIKHKELNLPITCLKTDIEDAGGERQYIEMASAAYADITL